MHDTTPPAPDFPPPPPQKKPRTNLIIIASAVAVIAAIVATGVIITQDSDGGSEPAAASSSPTESAEAAAVEEPTPAYSALDTDDFSIKLRKTRQQCFGSAGCNVTVEPELSYLGFTEDMDPDAVYAITYEIRGDESGPVIATAELSDRTSLSYTPTSISTVSSGTKVSAKITGVQARGY
jgi:hypothetical protein